MLEKKKSLIYTPTPNAFTKYTHKMYTAWSTLTA